ncbi:MAG: hypothetical protein ACFHWX_03200 [Bacteroidota bacterium]
MWNLSREYADSLIFHAFYELTKKSFMPNRRERRKQEKDRVVGLQFSLNGIPKEELDSLKVRYRFTNNGLELDIRTDNHVIETNSFKGYRKNMPGYNLKLSNYISNTNQTEIIPNIERFDHLFAIDTNSLKLPEKDFHHHIGAAFQLVSQLDRTRNEELIELIQIFSVHGACEKPENHNWRNLVNFIRNQRSYLVNESYGIIVDSDLGNLNDFNQRKLPIVDDFLLPPNFQLIYASSDLANDELTNQMISMCDKISKQILIKMKSDIEKSL